MGKSDRAIESRAHLGELELELEREDFVADDLLLTQWARWRVLVLKRGECIGETGWTSTREVARGFFDGFVRGAMEAASARSERTEGT